MQTVQISLVNIDLQEQACRDQVIAKATKHQLKVLHLFGERLTPLEVANRLKRSIKTIDTHKTRIFELCRNAWNLPLNEALNYRFLWAKFSHMEHYANIQPASKELSIEEHAYCNKVITKTTPCQLKVLRLFADGLTPKQVSAVLVVSIKTVNTHKTCLLTHCRQAWKIDKQLDYHFLNEKFAAFF